MPDEVFETVRRIVCEVIHADPENVTADTSFSDLDINEEDFYTIYQKCCAEVKTSMNSILNTMPIYRIRAGIQVMASLRKLAPFSKKAAMILDKYDVHFEDVTIESLAQTMYKGRYISSGKTQPPLHPPRGKFYVCCWLLAVLVSVFIIPFGLAYLPCSSIKTECSSPIWTQMKAMLPVTVLIGVLSVVFAFGPGLWAVKQYEKKLKQRAEKWGDHRSDLSD